MPYIYCITNLVNNKKYIGKTVTSIAERFSKHKHDAFVQNSNYAIHVAMRKYGIEAFDIQQLEECSMDQLSLREQYWIAYYDSYNNGYNLTIGGDGNPKYDYSKIYTLFLTGLNEREIAKEIECERHTVARALHAFDIDESVILQNKHGNAKQAVAQIDCDTGMVLQTFASLTEAALAEGVSVSYISLICKGQRKLKKNYTYKKI